MEFFWPIVLTVVGAAIGLSVLYAIIRAAIISALSEDRNRADQSPKKPGNLPRMDEAWRTETQKD